MQLPEEQSRTERFIEHLTELVVIHHSLETPDTGCRI